MARQCPRIKPFDADDSCRLHVVLESKPAAPVARELTGFLHHEPLRPNPRRLNIFWSDPIVTDVRTGHRNDLPLIGWIGQNLLVSGHGGVEYDFANCLAFVAERASFKYLPVSQGQECLPHAGIPSCHKDRLAFRTSNQIPKNIFTI